MTDRITAAEVAQLEELDAANMAELVALADNHRAELVAWAAALDALDRPSDL